MRDAIAENIRFDHGVIRFSLSGGRTVSVPLAWFPRLLHGTESERANWTLIGQGEGIQWPELDEDISVESLLAGRGSGEAAESLRRWPRRRGGSESESELTRSIAEG